MTQPSLTDWMQGIGSLVAIGLSVGSLVWQWRTARKTKEDRLTCEAMRMGPGVWRMDIAFEADNRAAPPKLRVKVKNPLPETALVADGEVPRRPDGAGNFPLNIGAIFDLRPKSDLVMEMAYEAAPSRWARAQIFVRNPVEETSMRTAVEVRTGGLFPAAKRTFELTPVR